MTLEINSLSCDQCCFIRREQNGTGNTRVWHSGKSRNISLKFCFSFIHVYVLMYCVMMQNKIYLLLWIRFKKFEIHCSIEEASHLWLDHFSSLPIFPREMYYWDHYFITSKSKEAHQHFLYTKLYYVWSYLHC